MIVLGKTDVIISFAFFFLMEGFFYHENTYLCQFIPSTQIRYSSNPSNPLTRQNLKFLDWARRLRSVS